MLKRIFLSRPMEGLPTWWLCFVILRLMWLGPELTEGVLPLAVQLLLGVVIFLVTLPLAVALTGWMRAQLNYDSCGGLHSDGSLEEQ